MPDHYFENVLPNYEAQCAALAFVLIVTTLFWMLLFPYAANKLFFESEAAPTEEKKPSVTKSAQAATTSKQRKGKGKKTSTSSTVFSSAFVQQNHDTMGVDQGQGRTVAVRHQPNVSSGLAGALRRLRGSR